MRSPSSTSTAAAAPKTEKQKAKDRKAKIVQKICTELTVHSLIEEEIFYPATEEAVELVGAVGREFDAERRQLRGDPLYRAAAAGDLPADEFRHERLDAFTAQE